MKPSSKPPGRQKLLFHRHVVIEQARKAYRQRIARNVQIIQEIEDARARLDFLKKMRAAFVQDEKLKGRTITHRTLEKRFDGKIRNIRKGILSRKGEAEQWLRDTKKKDHDPKLEKLVTRIFSNRSSPSHRFHEYVDGERKRFVKEIPNGKSILEKWDVANDEREHRSEHRALTEAEKAGNILFLMNEYRHRTKKK